MRFSFYILFLFSLYLSVSSCQKDKPISTASCINDTMNNYVGKFRLFEFNFGPNSPKKYIDTFDVEITKASCKTLKISDLADYEFSFDTSLYSDGKYFGYEYCHCRPRLFFFNRDTLELENYCGGGGSPCSLGMMVSLYDGFRLR